MSNPNISAIVANNLKLVQSWKPQTVWNLFSQLSGLPRLSRQEHHVRHWLKNHAVQHSWIYNEDDVGNVLIRVPENDSSLSNAPIVVLQAHMDMVCESNNNHNFEKDPIQFEIMENEQTWLTATETTLGADNGIGLCIALAIAQDESIKHAPLELLFTADEEEGMTGAGGLKEGFVTGKIILNLDSEEDGAFYIGCAGAYDLSAHYSIDRFTDFDTSSLSLFSLRVDNLAGGHSGLDISNPKLANAIKLLSRLLQQISEAKIEYHLVSLQAGNKRNAIPRASEAQLYMTEQNSKRAQSIIDEFIRQSEYKRYEPEMKILLQQSNLDLKPQPFKPEFSFKILQTIHALPHGVVRMSPDIPNFVETSTNLAVIKTTSSKLIIETMQRSSHLEAMLDVCRSVENVFKLSGAQEILRENYLSPWQPRIDSPLLKLSKEAFVHLFKKDPHVLAIHAGLECGLILCAYPDADVISYGPTILGAHSPAERILVQDVEKCYLLTLEILKRIYNQ